MKISIALMCHTSRKDFIPYLIEKLGECRVFVDDGSLGVKKNAMRCWESYDKDADYHLVIQDDAIFYTKFFRDSDRKFQQDFILDKLKTKLYSFNFK